MVFFLFIFFSLIKGAVRDAAQLPVLRIIDFFAFEKGLLLPQTRCWHFRVNAREGIHIHNLWSHKTIFIISFHIDIWSPPQDKAKTGARLNLKGFFNTLDFYKYVATIISDLWNKPKIHTRDTSLCRVWAQKSFVLITRINLVLAVTAAVFVFVRTWSCFFQFQSNGNYCLD